MLDQPCATCGEMLDVNTAVCPRCGLPRRRQQTPPRAAGWVRILLILCATMFGTLVGSFTVPSGQWPDPGVAEGGAILGAVSGLILGLVAARLLAIRK